jgi:hypothetical protein
VWPRDVVTSGDASSAGAEMLHLAEESISGGNPISDQQASANNMKQLVKRAPSLIPQQLRGIVEAKRSHSLYNESCDRSALLMPLTCCGIKRGACFTSGVIIRVKARIDPWIDRFADHPIRRNPNTLVHILRALDPRSGVPIRHVSRKLWSSPDLEKQGARRSNQFMPID